MAPSSTAEVSGPSFATNRKKQPEHFYYLPEGDFDDKVRSLMEREDLTEQDILDFCHGKPPRPLDLDKHEKLKMVLLEAYHKRRTEISDLVRKLWTGEAVVDDDGRLIPVPNNNNINNNNEEQNQNRNNNNNNNNQQLNNNNNQQLNNNNNQQLNNNNGNNNNIGGGILNWNPNPINNIMNQQPFPVDNEEEERRWLEREERDAAEAIARAVQRYRKEGVSEEDFVLIKVQPAERAERANLTFRRICFAVLAVVTAFICIMLQTLPLFPRDSNPYPRFDKLLHELMQVRFLEEHVQACSNLQRSPPPPRRFWHGLFAGITGMSNRYVDCSLGVLHIPAKDVLIDSFLESPTNEAASLWEPYVMGLGINVSWFMPCHAPTNVTLPSACQSHPELRKIPDDSCSMQEDDKDVVQRHYHQNQEDRCFRGVHDNVVSDQAVGEILRMGAQLIQEGGDHFDIHDDVSILDIHVPSVLHTIRDLLRDTYAVPGNLVPVAFRVNAVGPMDGSGVHLHGTYGHASDFLLRLLNKTVSIIMVVLGLFYFWCAL